MIIYLIFGCPHRWICTFVYADIPWVDDPLRESPQDRDELSVLYKQYLIKYQKPFVEVSGQITQRQEIIKSQMFEVCGIRF